MLRSLYILLFSDPLVGFYWVCSSCRRLNEIQLVARGNVIFGLYPHTHQFNNKLMTHIFHQPTAFSLLLSTSLSLIIIKINKYDYSLCPYKYWEDFHCGVNS